ncbi:MAG TPA: hypothetical protein VMI94_17970 [Bryobacteraceae bacterium]|nr:hypothetical protein [Bryobacteraceae bacterium]
MRIRMLLPALMIGAGLLLPIAQTPALAKTSYKRHKIKSYKYKVRKFKAKKAKRIKPSQARRSRRT